MSKKKLKVRHIDIRDNYCHPVTGIDTPASEGKASHSPLPWYVAEGTFIRTAQKFVKQYGFNGKKTLMDDTVAVCSLMLSEGGREANAEFICLAVNNHAKLVEAVIEYHGDVGACHLKFCDTCQILKQSRSGEGR